MRAFAAIVPSPRAMEQLSLALASLRTGAMGADHRLRWTDPDNWHITTAFYGEVPDGSLPDLLDQLGTELSDARPVTLRLQGGGAFGGTVGWIGVGGQLDRLADIAQRCARPLVEPAEDRSHPHLTIVRSRRGRIPRELIDVLSVFRSESFTASEVTLFSSHLGAGRSGQPRYEPIGQVPLGS